jgi:hypothetical protein
LEQVSANTREYLTYTGVKVDDIWHEKGKVFASLSGPDWKTSVVSSGNFTKDDVIMFTINQDGGYATVATAQNDPIFKFAKNDKCETRWETSDRIGQEASQILSDLTDIDGNAIKVGNRLEWYLKSGPMRGEVVKASEDGKILVGMTYDEYGPSHQGAYGSVVELTQNEINGLNIKAY